MARNLTVIERLTIESQIASATSIGDVTRIARVACGYRFTTRNPLVDMLRDSSAHHARANGEYTAADRAWFKRPVEA